ncbi:MAG: guanylate kinase [Clostridiales bacterium]|nr:guanylate kinase [Clostridiales bacterium]MDY3745272.1 guanylate kinase [Lachnospiraceae bacterium]
MKKQGILTVISGFSGAGKGTVVRRLMEKYPEDYCLSVSATTRAPRENEIPGVHYLYVTKEEFEQMIEEHQLLEYAQYVDNYYGTPKKFVVEHLNKGIHVILEIEMQGALKIKKRYPEALLIFLTPPDAKTLEERLRNRGTEDEATIVKRLKRAGEEAVYMNDYDYIVLNEEGRIDECVDQLHRIICDQQYRVENSSEFIQGMADGLKVFIS